MKSKRDVCERLKEREREQSVEGCSMCPRSSRGGRREAAKDEAGMAGKGSKEGLAKNPDLILKAVEALTGFKQRNDIIN